MSKEAMKLALEALEDQRIFTMRPDHEGKELTPAKVTNAITALREALAKPDFWEGYVPEPVKPAQCSPAEDGVCESLDCSNHKPAQQEPVAYLCENAVGHKYFRWKKPSSTYKPIALYTSPPAQRTWVGLTDEEYSSLHDGLYQQGKSLGWVVDQIEDKLREKNT